MSSLINYLLQTLLICVTCGSTFRNLVDSIENPLAKRAKLHKASVGPARFTSLSPIVVNSMVEVLIENPKTMSFSDGESVLRLDLAKNNALKVERSSSQHHHYIISQKFTWDLSLTAIGISGEYTLPVDAGYVFYLALRRSIETFDLHGLFECMKTDVAMCTGYLFKVDAIIKIE